MQSLRLQTMPLDTLGPEEADKLRNLFVKLKRGNRILGSKGAEGKAGLDHLLTEQESLNIQVQQMDQGIRTRPGVETFMNIDPFNKLAESAAHGPVVLLIASDAACSAVALPNTQGGTF